MFTTFKAPIMVGWLIRFNVGLELRNGLLPTVCDLSLRIVRRHAITILILHGGDGFPFLVHSGMFAV